MHPLFVCKFCTPVGPPSTHSTPVKNSDPATLVRILRFSRDSCSIPVANAAPRKIQGNQGIIRMGSYQ